MTYTPRHARNPGQRLSVYAAVTSVATIVLVTVILTFLSATQII